MGVQGSDLIELLCFWRRLYLIDPQLQPTQASNWSKLAESCPSFVQTWSNSAKFCQTRPIFVDIGQILSVWVQNCSNPAQIWSNAVQFWSTSGQHCQNSGQFGRVRPKFARTQDDPRPSRGQSNPDPGPDFCGSGHGSGLEIPSIRWVVALLGLSRARY